MSTETGRPQTAGFPRRVRHRPAWSGSSPRSTAPPEAEAVHQMASQTGSTRSHGARVAQTPRTSQSHVDRQVLGAAIGNLLRSTRSSRSEGAVAVVQGRPRPRRCRSRRCRPGRPRSGRRGSADPDGLVADWHTPVVSGRNIVQGDATIKADDGHGGSDTHTFSIPPNAILRVRVQLPQCPEDLVEVTMYLEVAADVAPVPAQQAGVATASRAAENGAAAQEGRGADPRVILPTHKPPRALSETSGCWTPPA